MKITCPNCETNFSVPESALGPKGRTLRCARCGHKWHVDPPGAADMVEAADSFPADLHDTAATRPMARETLDARMGGADFRADGLDDRAASLDEQDDGGFGDTLDEDPAEPEEDPLSKIAELMRSSAPEPIPDVFAAPQPKRASRRKGAAGLWLLLLVLLLGSAGAVLYFFQDRIIDRWPELAHYYDELHLRNEVVGAGLSFRNYSSERLVQDNNEVLIVRGVIANSTDQPREIPLLRLALYNNQALLQDKIINPPQTTLDARGTVGFRITLDQPDPNATRFEVTFTAPKTP